MATVDVLNWKKQKVGQLQLSSDIFEVEVKKEVLHEVVKWQLASRRSGTHMVKTRAFVSGGGKKPFKQKGTGNARQGSNRSPLMPGGAKLFGPEPRSYAYALPKKVRKLGLKMAISYLLKQGKLVIVDQLQSNGKTKELNVNLKSLGVSKAVVIGTKADEMCSRAARNLPSVKFCAVEGMNVFDLLKYDFAVLSQDAVKLFSERASESL